MSNTIHIEVISYGSGLYQESLILRDKVLRKPLGMCLFDEKLDHENKDWHIGALYNDKLIGILILTILDDRTVKMRQVALDEGYRGKGFGKELMLYAEKLALQKGYKQVVLNARLTAVSFYEKLGYSIIGDTFIEVTLPHKKMTKLIESAEERQ